MHKLALSTAALCIAAGGIAVGAGPASASPTYDPNVARPATAVNACTSIPGTVRADAALFGFTPDLSSFSLGGCISTLSRHQAYASDINEETGQPYGDPYAQCDLLVGVGALHYPSTLHSGENGAEEDDLFPDLTVTDRTTCGNALYAFHAITTFFPAGP